MWGQAQYILAAKRFVTRDFAGTQSLLDPLLMAKEVGDPIRAQVWILWAALCDRAFSANWEGAAELRAYIAKEEVWNQVSDCFDGLENVPCPVVSEFVDVIARRCSPQFKETERAVELFLSKVENTSDKQRIVRSYIVDIQARGNSSFDYAVELAKSATCFDDSQRRQVLKEIARAHKKYMAAIEQAYRADEKRVIAAMSASQKLQQQQQQTQSQAQSQTSTPAQNGRSSLPASPPKTKKNIASNSSPSSGSSAMSAKRTPLVQQWRQWLVIAVKTWGVYQVIIIILALGAFKFKKSLLTFGNQVVPWLWTAMREAAKMGLTVTYL